jgi:hypothetical protein
LEREDNQLSINFPNAPTLNQLYPQPPVVGLPVYKWDGEKWTVPAAAGTTKTPVYTDGSTPMTAQLKLFGSPPVATNDAAPKNYVDATLAGTIKADGSVPMTGQLTVQTPPVNPTDAASKTYVDNAWQRIAQPTRTVLVGSGSYAPPANCLRLRVRLHGGGGGGAGSGTSNPVGTSGGDTLFGTMRASGGIGGNGQTGGGGGTLSGVLGNQLFAFTGAQGQAGVFNGANLHGGDGGGGALGGRGIGGPLSTSGGTAQANTGSGGGGGGSQFAIAGSYGGAGGGAGAFIETMIVGPAASYSYAVGAVGAAGAAGTSGQPGGAGAAGFIVIEEFYGP